MNENTTNIYSVFTFVKSKEDLCDKTEIFLAAYRVEQMMDSVEWQNNEFNEYIFEKKGHTRKPDAN